MTKPVLWTRLRTRWAVLSHYQRFEGFVALVLTLVIGLVILVALFAAQSRGTARVAAFFGPVTCVWFAAIAVQGLVWIAARPEVVAAQPDQADVERSQLARLHDRTLRRAWGGGRGRARQAVRDPSVYVRGGHRDHACV